MIEKYVIKAGEVGFENVISSYDSVPVAVQAVRLWSRKHKFKSIILERSCYENKNLMKKSMPSSRTMLWCSEENNLEQLHDIAMGIVKGMK